MNAKKKKARSRHTQVWKNSLFNEWYAHDGISIH